MKLNFLALILLLCVSLPVDAYIARVIRRRTNKSWVRWLHWIMCAIALGALIGIVAFPIKDSSESRFIIQLWMFLTFLSITGCQIVFTGFDLLSRLPLLWKRKELRWLSVGGAIVATLWMVVIWWGALINRFNIEVSHVTVEIDNLPESFDGYTIAQISDLHVGTYGDDTSFISSVVDSINNLKPDMIAFTGDIINRRSVEAPKFIDVLSRMEAPDGIYAILGNHDYCHYYGWVNGSDQIADHNKLLQYYADSPIDLLVSESRQIKRGNDSIALIGMEFVSGPPSPYHPSLEQAYPDTNDEVIKILLSHDPNFWNYYIANNPGRNIALTLSGHTHAMQMEIFGWSPAKLMTPVWGGLFVDNDGRALYVNRGIGTVGTPMRIGATPEITLITLRRR